MQEDAPSAGEKEGDDGGALDVDGVRVEIRTQRRGGTPYDAMNNLVAHMVSSALSCNSGKRTLVVWVTPPRPPPTQIPPLITSSSFSFFPPTKRFPTFPLQLSNLTASMRFPGDLNVDINEITSTLVPFPRMHFLSTSLTPLVGSGISMAGRPADSRLCERIVAQGLGNSSMLVNSDLRAGLHLACGILLRGPFAISDVTATVQRQQAALRMVSWNPDGFKIGLCSSSPLYSDVAALCISNNCSIAGPLGEGYGRFLRLYRARAHLHHYLEYLPVDEFQHAAEAVTSLVADYGAQE